MNKNAIRRRRRGSGGSLSGILFSASEPGFTFEPWDITTLYQDRAGTTPVTAAGQSVGLRLDKSKGLRQGPELVTNGDFSDGTTGWTLGAGWSISGGSASRDATVGGSNFTGGSGVEVGKTYRVTWTQGPTTVAVYLGSPSGPLLSNTGTAGTYSVLVAATVTGGIVFRSAATVTGIDNISVRELSGNHQVAVSDAKRGVYGWMPKTGKRNLLTYSEQFDNAAWTLNTGGVASAVVRTANAGAAPDGTNTADRLQFSLNGGTTSTDISEIRQAVLGNGNLHFSIYLKSNDSNTYQVQIVGALTTSVVSVTPNWQRFSLAGSASSTNVSVRLRGAQTPTTSNTADILAWGAQAEVNSTATAYQRVGSAFDVTEAGVPTCYYVQADGVDDAYVTPTITPNTDKVQVFAGVRKLSDAARGIFAEFSASIALNNGGFALTAPDAASATSAFESKGTVLSSAVASGLTAPITSVFSAVGDIAADTATLRRNGVQVATSATDQGTGNYLSYPAYIYARGGTSLPFNGLDFGHAVRFGPNLAAATIARVESLIARNTPEVTL